MDKFLQKAKDWYSGLTPKGQKRAMIIGGFVVLVLVLAMADKILG